MQITPESPPNNYTVFPSRLKFYSKLFGFIKMPVIFKLKHTVK